MISSGPRGTTSAFRLEPVPAMPPARLPLTRWAVLQSLMLGVLGLRAAAS